MKYNIQINQFVLSKTSLDLIDCAILDWVYCYCSSKSDKIEAKRFEGWTWISYAEIIKDMPLLRIKSKGAITRRIANIKKEGYIETLLKTEKIYIKILPKTDELFFRTVDNGERSDKTVDRNERNRSRPSTVAVDNGERTINTINHSTKPNKSSAEAHTQKEVVKPKDFADKFFKDVLTLVNLPKGTKPPPELEWLTNMLHELHERNNNVPKAALWSEIKDFCAYWNEQNHMGTKRKWEMQKTFEIGRRLTTWFSRAKFKGFTASVDFNSKPKGSNMII